MKRVLVRSAALLAPLLLAAIATPRLGAWLVVEDPLDRADAIVVLSGTMYERQLEAADLYRAGYAPRIYVLREIQDWGEVELQQRGVRYTRIVDVQIDALVKVGVPREVITVLDSADSTAEEAGYVYDLVTKLKLSRLIVVTSKQHTRRARMAINRRLQGTGATVIVRATRYDRSDVDRWWQNRSTLRFTLFETQRLIAYWIGIAD